MGYQFPEKGSNHVPYIERQILDHWVFIEVPYSTFLYKIFPKKCSSAQTLFQAT